LSFTFVFLSFSLTLNLRESQNVASVGIDDHQLSWSDLNCNKKYIL